METLISSQVPLVFVIGGIVITAVVSWSRSNGSGLFFGAILLAAAVWLLGFNAVFGWIPSAYELLPKWVAGMALLLIAWAVKLSLVDPYEKATGEFMDKARQVLILVAGTGLFHVTWSVWSNQL